MSEKLKLGKMTTKEIVKWLGVSYNTYLKKKDEYLKTIQESYARIKPIYGGIIVDSIKVEEYIKPNNSNYKNVKSRVDKKWNKNGLDTRKNVANKIYNDGDLTITKGTTYAYVCNATLELYGNEKREGELGSCHYMLCVLDEKTGEPRFFTENEQKKKKQIWKKYFGYNGEENQKLIETKEAIFFQLAHGEITDEECQEYVHQIDKGRYFNYLAELQEALGDVTIIRGTYVERNILKYKSKEE